MFYTMKDPIPDYVLMFQLVTSFQTSALGQTATFTLPNHSHTRTTPIIVTKVPPVHPQHPLTPLPQFLHEAGVQSVWNQPITSSPAGFGMFQFSGSFFHFDHVSPLRDPSPDFLLKFQLAPSPQTPARSQTVTYSSPINPVPGHFKFHPAIHSLYPLTPIAQSSCETSLQIIWN